jgi:hypothetical protein
MTIESDELQKIESLIGYSINNINKATDYELDQWEKVVVWARAKLAGYNVGPRPPIPHNVCITSEQKMSGRKCQSNARESKKHGISQYTESELREYQQHTAIKKQRRKEQQAEANRRLKVKRKISRILG